MTIRNIALFIDAANVDPARVSGIIKICSYIGEISIRKAFGDFTSPGMTSWADACRKLGIEPILAQSASDGNLSGSGIALTIGLTEILNNKRVDVDIYAIAGNLADFSPLCAAIKNKGKKVLGFGASSMSVPYRNTFNKFVTFESIPAILAKAASRNQPAYEPLPEIPAPGHATVSETITPEDKAFAAKAEDIGVTVEKNSEGDPGKAQDGEDASIQNQEPVVNEDPSPEEYGNTEPEQDTVSDNELSSDEQDLPVETIDDSESEPAAETSTIEDQPATMDEQEQSIPDDAEYISPQAHEAIDQAISENIEENPAAETETSNENSVLSDDEKQLLNEEFNNGADISDTRKPSRLSKIFGLFRKGKAGKQELANLDAPPEFGDAYESAMEQNSAANEDSGTEEPSLYDSVEAIVGEDVAEPENDQEISAAAASDESSEIQDENTDREADSSCDAEAPEQSMDNQDESIREDTAPSAQDAACDVMTQDRPGENKKESILQEETKSGQDVETADDDALNDSAPARADFAAAFAESIAAAAKQSEEYPQNGDSSEDSIGSEATGETAGSEYSDKGADTPSADESEPIACDIPSEEQEAASGDGQDLADIPEAAADLAKKFNFRISKSDISPDEPSLFDTESAVTNDEPVEQLPVSSLILETLESALVREHNGEMGVNAALNLLSVRGITPDWRSDGFNKWSDYLDSLTKTVPGASMEVLGSIIRLKTSNSTLSPAFLDSLETAFASNGIAEMNMASLEGFIRMNDESFTPAKYGSYSSFAELMKDAEKTWPESVKTEGDTVFFSPKQAEEEFVPEHEFMNAESLESDVIYEEDKAPDSPSEEEKALAKFFAEKRRLAEQQEYDIQPDAAVAEQPEIDIQSDAELAEPQEDDIQLDDRYAEPAYSEPTPDYSEHSATNEQTEETDISEDLADQPNDALEDTSLPEDDAPLTNAEPEAVSDIEDTQTSELSELPAEELPETETSMKQPEEAISAQDAESEEQAPSIQEQKDNPCNTDSLGGIQEEKCSETASEDEPHSKDEGNLETISPHPSENTEPLTKDTELQDTSAPAAEENEIASSECANQVSEVADADVAADAPDDGAQTHELSHDETSEETITNSVQLAAEPERAEDSSENSGPHAEFEPIFEDPSDAEEPIIIQPSVAKRIEDKEYELADDESFALPKSTDAETETAKEEKENEPQPETESIALSDAEPVVAPQPEPVAMPGSLEQASFMIDECFEQEGKNSLMMKKLLSSLNRNHPELGSGAWDTDTLAILIDRLNDPVKRYRIVAGCVTKV